MTTPAIPRLVLTTVGTSLVTNGATPDEQRLLRDCANKRERELSPREAALVEARCTAARTLLSQGDAAARRASAELNGLLGVYEGRRGELARDAHVLVATDTAQGAATASIVEGFLRARGATHIDTWAPRGFNTLSARGFGEGVRALLRLCEETLPGYRVAGTRVLFNTVGGFKSQRDMLNIAGMFHADEIVYIFEGEGSPLLRIPRLPIRIDLEGLRAHAATLLLLAAGLPVGTKERPLPPDLPEALLDEPDASGGRLLSAWGDLVWGRARDELLADAPAGLPFLRYEPSFLEDWKRIPRDGRRLRTRVQEKCAEVAAILAESKGNPEPLFRRDGLNFERFKGENARLATFRVTNAQGAHRVSCEPLGGGQGLSLRHVGPHDEVNARP